ncbi:Transcriptional regulator [gamma proteobacterium HdN1]|nr:Transcriptional regulator [gamma proteobacterium HdN1]
MFDIMENQQDTVNQRSLDEPQDNAFVSALLKETERELDGSEPSAFPVPGQSAKANVLFYSIGVFARKGIADTTVQDLLEAANVSRRTFYKYFKNKVDVLECIYEIASNQLIGRFRAEMNLDSVSVFVVRCVGLYFDYHTTLGPLVRMMTEEARRSDSPLAQHREKTIDHLVRLFNDKYVEKVGVHLDLQVYYALIWAMESASIHLLTNTKCTHEDVERCKSVMAAIAARVMVSDPDEAIPLPTVSA